MKILLVSPRYPDTYWSFRHALKFIAKKAANPPLGLLTIAAMLPSEWDRKLVDINVSPLLDADIIWADFVFISAMSIQLSSASQVIERSKKFRKPIVAGGPLFTGDPESFMHLDHLILNEAEITLPLFLADLEKNQPEKVYKTDKYANILHTPQPDYSLIKTSHYAQLSIQYSRGCPFNCEFCEITALLGRRVRTKSSLQIINELTNIFQTGFRGNVFFVDDNFIGNRKKLKEDLLPEIINWNKAHKNPFHFTTEASINLADDSELMELMAQAGFDKVFVGIETVDKESLAECDKILNLDRDLIESVHLIQSAGIEVSAGFIVGFDHDSPGIFQRQIDFIQKSGIITAMVGLLNAPNKTRLYKRLHQEGRITMKSSGDNTNFSMNFIPIMNKEILLKGYTSIVNTIYSNKAYYERLIHFFSHFKPRMTTASKITFGKLLALFRSVFYLGVLSKGRFYYWKLFFWSLLRKPRLFPLAITYSIYGYHFRKIFGIVS